MLVSGVDIPCRSQAKVGGIAAGKRAAIDCIVQNAETFILAADLAPI